MRVVKEAEARRNEILDAAGELFGQKGFDGTSTGDILGKVGIARGTLYYHFKSKEDIMDALIERTNATILHAAQQVAEDKSIPVIERILRAVMALNISSGVGSSTEIMEHIHKPQNALMHQKVQKAVIRSVPPILASIISEGIEQGIFSTPYPYECMEMVVVYATTIFDNDMVDMTEEERMSRILAFIANVERLLGAAGGSLMSVMQMFGGGGAEEGNGGE
ncbi:TetR/AcrR family transcriptional regulator [Paenibacillus sp. FSL R7-0337]|uniref:TetR/AcrR family transcriptional regulator n=1 Tax=unclassified Paenibacillus TaxID=185978 RepID=UPI00096FDA34|nr:TetR/AcrR family transcriptional regulator [Paenibacillus sp. FSL R7-0337]OMF99248.1 TetR family transcriptional regulator [Paenibacillus sp. FSL R7-0337]